MVEKSKRPAASSAAAGGRAVPLLICRDLTKSFGDLAVVRRVSLDVSPGHILALLGPSGCGKTTTLRLIAGFEELDDGRIEISGRLVADDRLHLPPEQRRVGMVFQDYAIFPHLSVARNIGFGLGKGKEAEMRVAELLEFVGLAGYGDKMPQELSGGEQQRVSLARALSMRPDVLLLDEPFSNLDATLRSEVRREVRTLLKRSGTTAVFVTHDQEEALFLGDEVAVLRAGQVEQVGTPETVFHRPRTRFVAEFMGQTDFVPGVVAGDRIDTPLGVLKRQTRLPVGTVVDVAVRPDDVALAPDESADCRVISRQFIGIANLYLVRLADGTTVRSWQPHDLILEEEAAVRASLTGDELPVFHQDAAV